MKCEKSNFHSTLTMPSKCNKFQKAHLKDKIKKLINPRFLHPKSHSLTQICAELIKPTNGFFLNLTNANKINIFTIIKFLHMELFRCDPGKVKAIRIMDSHQKQNNT